MIAIRYVIRSHPDSYSSISYFAGKAPDSTFRWASTLAGAQPFKSEKQAIQFVKRVWPTSQKLLGLSVDSIIFRTKK